MGVAASVGDVASHVRELYPKQAEKYSRAITENLVDGIFVRDLKNNFELQEELWDEMGCTKLHTKRLEREIAHFAAEASSPSAAPPIEDIDPSWDPSTLSSLLAGAVPHDEASIVAQMNLLVDELQAIGWKKSERSKRVRALVSRMEVLKRQEMEAHRETPQSLVNSVTSHIDKSFVESYENNHQFLKERDAHYNSTVTFASELSSLIANNANSTRQSICCLYLLYVQARAIHPCFKRFVAAIAAKVNGAEYRVAAIKKMARIVEKGVYAETTTRGDYSSVKDIVRGCVICKNMADVREVLELVQSSKEVTIVRIKNRFAHPTTGGWADVSVNVVFDADVTMHVCELQIALKLFWLVREDFNEHDAYGAFRQSYEILRVFGVDCSAKDLTGPLGDQLAREGIALATATAAADYTEAARAKGELERLHELVDRMAEIEGSIAAAAREKSPDYDVLKQLQENLDELIGDHASRERLQSTEDIIAAPALPLASAAPSRREENAGEGKLHESMNIKGEADDEKLITSYELVNFNVDSPQETPRLETDDLLKSHNALDHACTFEFRGQRKLFSRGATQFICRKHYITICAWIKADEEEAMGIFDAGREHAPRKRCFMSLRAGKVLFSFFDSDVWTRSSIPPGTYTHIAAVFDAHRGKAIFVNGKLDAEFDKNRQWCTARGPATLGGNDYDGPFLGQISGAAILNAPLDEKDIRGIMQTTRPI